MNVTPEQFASALADAQITILKYQPDKQKPVSLEGKKSSITVHDFAIHLRESLAEHIDRHLDVFKVTRDLESFKHTVSEYMKSQAPVIESDVPAMYRELRLNQDPTKKRDDAFYLTTHDERLSPIDAQFYLDAHGMKLMDARQSARVAIRKYWPRGPRGVFESVLGDGQSHEFFNTYVEPEYRTIADELPDELPPLVKKLVEHLFPLEIERRYFWAWMHQSLIGRTGVYLVLCGPPGTGKNRLKLLCRALHGHMNTVDGKKSGLDRFNAQFFDNTLLWWDELKYHESNENVLKEMQNDTLSEERKGVDATRSTEVWFNAVIANNNYKDNYIVFEGRKFVPLVITKKELKEAWTEAEIVDFNDSFEKADNLNQRAIAQTYRWVMRHGKPRGPTTWPNLEYKGPMFYRLAHTTMARWQQRAVEFLIRPEKRKGAKIEETKDGIRWSDLQYQITRKTKGSQSHEPSYSLVRAFLDRFADSNGRRVFETKTMTGDILSDFWVKQVVFDVKILTESDIEHEPDEQIKPVVKPTPKQETTNAERTPAEKEKTIVRGETNRRRDSRAGPVVGRGRPVGRRNADERLKARRERIVRGRKKT